MQFYEKKPGLMPGFLYRRYHKFNSGYIKKQRVIQNEI